MKKNLENLKKFICTRPFYYLDSQTMGDYLCCPSWCPTNIRESMDVSWNSSAAEDVRESIKNGSYSHCEHEICPSLSSLLYTDIVPSNFISHEEFSLLASKKDSFGNYQNGPSEVLLGFDRSCNLQCPSCRADLVINDRDGSRELDEKDKKMKLLENVYSKNVRRIVVTGSGDPFYSKVFRNFLVNFDHSKFPQIETIHIVTNGQLLNRKMWESLSCKEFIKTIEISIDAATKHTYENITRLGGKWDLLIDNLKFISTLEIEEITVSMVISELNFKEMKPFHDLITNLFSLFKGRINIHYRQHVFWKGSKYTEEELEKIQVFNPGHERINEFLYELSQVSSLPYVDHNFHHLL